MTKPADLELKTLFCTNSCTLLKMDKRWFAQCRNDKTCWSRAENEISAFCHFRTGRTAFWPFLAKCTSLCKTAFSARDQHVLSFSHWVPHLLTAFSKVHEFVQSSIFSPRSACFVIFVPGAPLLSDFQQSARVCTKDHFQPEISRFCHFCTGHTTF